MFRTYALKELHARASGPPSIILEHRHNLYLLNFPNSMSFNLVLDVVDLSLHRGTFDPPLLPTRVTTSHQVPALPYLLQQRDLIDFVFNDEIMASPHGGFHRLFINWRDRLGPLHGFLRMIL